ncbi:hypothetical protein [Actinoplanes sp. RD1]|uniref:hypothetical protein n=1 Tax=Actinoplanes sp. RD1 TaxID=3064538 RepID=UPI00274094F5|nr:hypothetical protein [Actinoplanes sp. RD1]
MFVELNQGHHPDPGLSIHDHITPEPLRDWDRVVAYLEGGHPLIDMMDIEDDPLDPGRQTMNGCSMLTDGDWLWRYDYAYYVRRHHVGLPGEFLQLIRARHYIVPERSYDELFAAGEEAAKYAFGLNGGVPFTPGDLG